LSGTTSRGRTAKWSTFLHLHLKFWWIDTCEFTKCVSQSNYAISKMHRLFLLIFFIAIVSSFPLLAFWYSMTLNDIYFRLSKLS